VVAVSSSPGRQDLTKEKLGLRTARLGVLAGAIALLSTIVQALVAVFD
jgi:hypothetical protein